MVPSAHPFPISWTKVQNCTDWAAATCCCAVTFLEAPPGRFCGRVAELKVAVLGSVDLRAAAVFSGMYAYVDGVLPRPLQVLPTDFSLLVGVQVLSSVAGKVCSSSSWSSSRAALGPVPNTSVALG